MRIMFIGVLALTTAGCAGDRPCQAPLDEACTEVGCPTSWQEAVHGSFEPDYGDADGKVVHVCSEGGFRVRYGWLWGATYTFDTSGELSDVLLWSDYSEFCGERSASKRYGEPGPCTATCELQAEGLGDDEWPTCP